MFQVLFVTLAVQYGYSVAMVSDSPTNGSPIKTFLIKCYREQFKVNFDEKHSKNHINCLI